MSRFADQAARELVDLGPCECPGTPHDSDWAKILGDLSSSEVQRAVALDDGRTPEQLAEGLAYFIPEWNLLGADGKDCPPSAESLLALRVPTLRALVNGVARVVERSTTAPNASSALSVASPRGSASPTRKRTPRPTT